MKSNHFFIMAIGIIAVVATGCNNSNTNKNQQVTYEARLEPLNSNVTGLQTSGEARFVVADDTMTVTIDVKNAPPGIEHWQHFHGFANDSSATCATAADDKNGDSIIDVAETGAASGTTMVPFNKMPAEMNVGSDTYPKAGADGSYHYETKIPMTELKTAFAKAFGGSDIDLDRRVLYIHGVPDSTNLPKSVASIGNIPAQVTIPIACGKINKVN